ncbi:MAG: TlpA family protein disulfide reductase [Nocardioides sp.]
MRLLAALAAVLVLAAGCAQPATTPGQSQVDVDTPQLRQLKAAAHVPDCPVVTGGAVDGGLAPTTLPCLGGGRSVDVSGLRGPMIVNLWASWCSVCRKELPALEQFHQRHGDEVKILGIDFQDVQPGAALALAKKSGLTYPLLADPQSDLSGKAPLPTLNGLPFTIFIDADGKVVHREYGAFTSVGSVVAAAQKYLGTTG